MKGGTTVTRVGLFVVSAGPLIPLRCITATGISKNRSDTFSKVEQVIELIQFVRQALEESDFRFLEWVSSEAFEIISKITRLHIITGEAINSVTELSEEDLVRSWNTLSNDQSIVKEECKNILLSPAKLKLLTPIAKADVLERICVRYTFEPYVFDFDNDELQASACMALLKSMDSQREFVEILRFMGEKGRKGDSNTLVLNFRRVFDYLLYRSKQANRARYWLQSEIGSYYPDIE